MSQVVRVNATDRRIKYSGYWTNDSGTMVLEEESQMFFMFRGSIYAWWIRF